MAAGAAKHSIVGVRNIGEDEEDQRFERGEGGRSTLAVGGGEREATFRRGGSWKYPGPGRN